MSQYYESSKDISNLFFVMPYTYILDDSIKIRTLILTADHSTLLFLPGFFLRNKELLFFFCGWASTWSRTHICMTLLLLTAHFSWPLPFLQYQKVETLPLFPIPPPPTPSLISDKSLTIICSPMLLIHLSWYFGKRRRFLIPGAYAFLTFLLILFLTKYDKIM